MRKRNLGPEEKVNVAIGMTDACVHICSDAIREQDQAISEEELMQRLRERIKFAKWRRREV